MRTDVESGSFALLKADMGLSTGKASKWFKAMTAGLAATPAAEETAPPPAVPSERATPPSSRALGAVGRSASTADGSFARRPSDSSAGALASALRGATAGIPTPINELTPSHVDSQTFSAWVGGIPLKYADESSLYHAFGEAGLGRGSIVKITVRVKDNKPCGSWALVALDGGGFHAMVPFWTFSAIFGISGD